MQEKINAFFEKGSAWQECMQALRKIVLQSSLDETMKWNVPCYMHEGKNILLLHGFKHYCAINFFKGALLSDKEHLLKQQTENVQEGRQIRYTDALTIKKQAPILEAYIKEAIAIEQNKIKLPLPEKKSQHLPDELLQQFSNNASLEAAFKALTPGRQRGYLLHFTEAKQSATITKRILAAQSKILMGKGLHDCTCGLSKRMPQCDGSHKLLSIK
ncbi:MAG: hypothetical protein RLZZ605_23 [Bacteroidota bacterium]|jgi:uncharacterized protein YdeI (YjbR/CyaY-like superfamily)